MTHGHRRAALRRSEAGFSFVEVTVASIILLVMTYLVATLSKSGSDAQHYTERLTRVTEIAQEVVDEIRAEVRSSVRMFGNDPTGLAYTAILDMTNMPPGTSGIRLPTIDPAGIFERDVIGSEKTGNALLFARHAWTDVFTPSSGNTYRIDTYRMVGFYLADEDGGPQPGRPIGLNLARYVSEPLIEGGQIDSISDPADQAEVLLHLRNATADDNGIVHDPAEVVWILGGDLADPTTLRQIDSMGLLDDNPIAPRTAPWQILRDPKRSSTGMLYYRHHSVATNYAPSIMDIGRYAIVDIPGGFPHGFEVQIVGPAVARQLMLHVTFASTRRDGHRAFHNLQAVQVARDL